MTGAGSYEKVRCDEKSTVLNFVHEMLKKNKQPLHYTVLMDEVVNKFYPSVEDVIRAKTRFYTWLNLDPRFTYLGQGMWGLRSWALQRGTRRVPLLTLMHKTVEYGRKA